MGLTHHPHGMSSFGMPVIGGGGEMTLGNVWFVDSGHEARGDAAGYGAAPDKPFATLDFAVSRCTASNGDVIFVAPGHAETIATATALALDVAGIKVIGLGQGANRPVFTVATLAAATITISANNVTWVNCVVVGALDGLNTAITVTGNDVTLDLEYRDTSVTVEADIVIAVTGDRPKIRLRDIGFAGGDQRDQSITLTGVDNARIGIDFYGKVNTAVVDMLTTCTDVEVRGTMYVSGTTNGSKNVVDTAGTSTWYMDIVDAAAGASYSGGSAVAVASSDVSALAAALYGAGGITTFPAAAIPANAVSLAEVIRQLYAALEGTAADQNGVATWPTGAAYASGVSIAEVLAYIQDAVRRGTGTVLPADVSLYDLIGGAKGHPAFPVAADPANDVSLIEVVRAIWANLCGTAAGENGVTTWPTAAAYASAVSIAEVLAYIQDAVRQGTGTVLPNNVSLYDVIGGTKGHPAFPVAAVPANDVSMIEVLRDVWASLCGTAAGENGVQTWPASAAPASGVSIAEVLGIIYDTIIGAAGIAAFPNAADPANGISEVEVVRAIWANLCGTAAGENGITTWPAAAAPGANVSLAEVVRDQWDVLRNGTGGIEPGANRSIIDEIKGSALNVNGVNYLVVTADMSSATWNTATTHEVFTVTGMVRMRVLVECTGTLQDAADLATISLGDEVTAASFIAATDAAGKNATTISAGELWCDATPADVVTAFATAVLDRIVPAGLDVGYTIGGEALTGGSLVFHCWWEPLNATGAVAAGAGGVLA